MGSTQLQTDVVRTLHTSESLMSATFVSDTLHMEQFTSVAFQANVTATASTPVFAIQVQVSLDDTNWGDYGSPTACTADGVLTWELSRTTFRHIRLSITRTTGSGKFEILSFAKQG